MNTSLLLARSAGGSIADRFLVQLDASRGEVIQSFRDVRTLDDACRALEGILPVLVSADDADGESQLTAEALDLLRACRSASVDVMSAAYEAVDATVKDNDRRLKLIEGLAVAEDLYLRSQAREILKAATAPTEPAAALPPEIPSVLLNKRNRPALLHLVPSAGAASSSSSSASLAPSALLDFDPSGEPSTIVGRSSKRRKTMEAEQQAASTSSSSSSSSSSSAGGSAAALAPSLPSSAELLGTLPFGSHPHPYPAYLGKPSVAVATAWKDNADVSYKKLKETLSEPIKRKKKAVAGGGGSSGSGASGSGFDGDEDPNEPLYCSCRQVAFGHMIACENPACAIEWFHSSCVGLTAANTPPNWHCPACTKKLERARMMAGAATAVAGDAAGKKRN